MRLIPPLFEISVMRPPWNLVKGHGDGWDMTAARRTFTAARNDIHSISFFHLVRLWEQF